MAGKTVMSIHVELSVPLYRTANFLLSLFRLGFITDGLANGRNMIHALNSCFYWRTNCWDGRRSKTRQIHSSLSTRAISQEIRNRMLSSPSNSRTRSPYQDARMKRKPPPTEAVVSLTQAAHTLWIRTTKFCGWSLQTPPMPWRPTARTSHRKKGTVYSGSQKTGISTSGHGHAETIRYSLMYFGFMRQ